MTQFMTQFNPFEGFVEENFGPGKISNTIRGLTAVYGEPNSADDPDKTDVAWDLISEHGSVHIYNYKNGPAYGNGPLDEIQVFSVQASTEEALEAFIAEASV